MRCVCSDIDYGIAAIAGYIAQTRDRGGVGEALRQRIGKQMGEARASAKRPYATGDDCDDKSDDNRSQTLPCIVFATPAPRAISHAFPPLWHGISLLGREMSVVHASMGVGDNCRVDILRAKAAEGFCGLLGQACDALALLEAMEVGR